VRRLSRRGPPADVTRSGGLGSRAVLINAEWRLTGRERMM
jgi:hypothetical protein